MVAKTLFCFVQAPLHYSDPGFGALLVFVGLWIALILVNVLKPAGEERENIPKP